MVCWSVCPLVTTLNSGKTDHSIEMPFGVMDRVGPRYHVQLPHGKGQIWGGNGAVTYIGRMRFRRRTFFPSYFGISCCSNLPRGISVGTVAMYEVKEHTMNKRQLICTLFQKLHEYPISLEPMRCHGNVFGLARCVARGSLSFLHAL